jgi:hypothetical protein
VTAGLAIEAATHGVDQRTGLEQALPVLLVVDRVRDDAAAAAQPHPATVELEGADGDVQLEPGQGAAVSDGAGIDLSWRRLKLMDDLDRPHLRGAGHRSGRESRAYEVAISAGSVERPVHIRDQMPHAGVRFCMQQPRDFHAACNAYPAEIVAHQIDDHHVLGPVLGRALQLAALLRGLMLML